MFFLLLLVDVDHRIEASSIQNLESMIERGYDDENETQGLVLFSLSFLKHIFFTRVNDRNAPLSPFSTYFILPRSSPLYG